MFDFIFYSIKYKANHDQNIFSLFHKTCINKQNKAYERSLMSHFGKLMSNLYFPSPPKPMH